MAERDIQSTTVLYGQHTMYLKYVKNCITNNGDITKSSFCSDRTEFVLKVKVKIGFFKCMGMMLKNLVHPYIQSTTVLCDNNHVEILRRSAASS